MSFADRVNEVLADPTNLHPEFLNYMLQYQTQNALPIAKTSGQRIAIGTRAASVSSAGTTFATGADLLSAALKFTAIGSNSYIVGAFATDWANNTAGAACNLRLNLDGADAGYVAVMSAPGANYSVPCAGFIIFTPAAGSHTINVRLTVSAGTGTVNGGAGGAGIRGPILVTLEIA